jgi:hypothetical protein
MAGKAIPAKFEKKKKQVHSSKSDEPTSSPSRDFVSEAIASLHNTKISVASSDSKSEAKLEFNPTVLAAMRGLMGSKTWRFLLNLQTSITSGTGTIATNIATNLTIFYEYTALVSLFDELKIDHLAAQFGLVNPGTGTEQLTFMAGIESCVIATTPTASTISRLPNAQMLSTWAPDHMLATHVKQRFPKSRPFGLTVEEGISAPRIASGMNSTIRVCHCNGSQTPANSKTYLTCRIWAVVQFRSRA